MHVNIGGIRLAWVWTLSPSPGSLGGMSRANRITRKSGIGWNVLSLSSIVYETSRPTPAPRREILPPPPSPPAAASHSPQICLTNHVPPAGRGETNPPPSLSLPPIFERPWWHRRSHDERLGPTNHEVDRLLGPPGCRLGRPYDMTLSFSFLHTEEGP